MKAIDTNVVVRFLTRDDPEQSPKAKALIEAGDVFVSNGVLLETEWVLRSVHKFSSAQVIASFRIFLGLPGVTVENPPVVVSAVNWAASGLDLEDAFHLAAAHDCEAFLTFDRRFAKRAKLVAAAPAVHAL
ncbi:MAG TPA: type II toxin-antitoxin system VapC family toxin [Methylocystis sp.]|nr:type II toxin-antitoxin system VapC family toxin [Methylocystis sp.]